MNESVHSLRDAAVFLLLDANSEYFQIDGGKAYRDETVFSSYRRPCRLIRVLFGLRNARGTFQRTVDAILFAFKRQLTVFYLEDIVVFLKSLEELTKHYGSVLTPHSDARNILKLKKYRILAKRNDIFAKLSTHAS